jgi:hypothetical protein
MEETNSDCTKPKENEGLIVQEKGPKYTKQRTFVVLYF